MNLPVRARLALWYFAVLLAAFAAFAWISDYGFRRSIEATVDAASRANLESIQSVIVRTAPQGVYEIKDELNELSGLWNGGSILQVTGEDGSLIFQSPQFTNASSVIPPATRSEVTYFTTNLNRLQYRIALCSMPLQGHTYRIHAAVLTEPFDQALDRFRLILRNTIPLLILFASLGGYWLSGRALAPVDEITRTARGIGVQNLSARLAVPRAHDELRRLSETLNEMLARIEASVKRLTQFTADASHDLRTPVALIRTSAELALRRPRGEAEYRETLTRILTASEETTHLIESLLILARADAGAASLRFAPTNALLHLEKAAEEASIFAAGKGVQFESALPGAALPIVADGAALERLAIIVLENAVKYTPQGGRVEMRAHSEPHNLVIEVADTGIGVAEKDLPHIFERFYRADQARSREPGGSGLGLSIAQWIVESHGGRIEARSTLGQGSLFRICFPLPEQACETPR